MFCFLFQNAMDSFLGSQGGPASAEIYKELGTMFGGRDLHAMESKSILTYFAPEFITTL